MCCAEFIVKYVLFFANLVFSLAGAVLMGVGIAVLVHIQGVEILQVAAIRAIPISVIVLGAVVFLIAFFGCCGAIRESRCFLMMYSIIMVLLAAGKTYLVVVLFQGLNNIQDLIAEWIGKAFNDSNMRKAFHVMEVAFKCCGTTGPNSYEGILPALPPSCCAEPLADQTCAPMDAFMGCDARIGGYFESFGGAIAGVVITVIIVEIVAFVFGFFLCYTIRSKRRVRTA